MIEITLPVFALIFGLFLHYLSEFATIKRKINKLWIQEIIFDNDIKATSENIKPVQEGLRVLEKPILNKELTKKFSKIECLSSEIDTLSDFISYLFILLMVSFIVLLIDYLFSLTSNPDWNSTSSILDSIKHIALDKTLTTGVLIAALFFILPQMLKTSLEIDIINPKKTNLLDMKLFDVWYKYRCFDYKQHRFNEKLEPKILYKLLAEKYISNNKTFDGREIEIPKDLIDKLKKEGLIPDNGINS